MDEFCTLVDKVWSDLGMQDGTLRFNEENKDLSPVTLEETAQGWDTRALAQIKDNNLRWTAHGCMATGSMVVIALFEFIRVWGEYLFTLTMIDDRNLFTLGIGMAMVFQGVTLEFGEFTTYGAQSAAYVMAAAPVAIFFIALQRWFVRGLMEGLKL